MTGSLRVIATAGHVDHGKSALIVALTGIDPDRFAEEKRRGLTIDLGYAWTTLPGGREVGFVDVPGHERFIRNMLAGVGPVRLVLFVVAADEGWKPQSEEHLQILDVLGVAGGVIALTKTDLVDAEAIALTTQDVRERVAGHCVGRSPDRAGQCEEWRRRRGPAGRARADRAGGAGPAGHTNPSLRGPRLLDHGCRHRRDRNADRRLPARRRRGGRRARRRAGADPFAADAQARFVRGLPRVACRREPRGRRARAAAPRLDRVPARRLPADHRVRGGGATRARRRAHPRAWRVHGAHGRGRDDRAPTRARAARRRRRPAAHPHRRRARARRRRPVRAVGIGAPAHRRRRDRARRRPAARRRPSARGIPRTARGGSPTAPRSRRSASRRPGRSAPTSSPCSSALRSGPLRPTAGGSIRASTMPCRRRSSTRCGPRTTRGRWTKGRRWRKSVPRAPLRVVRLTLRPTPR